MEMLIEAENLHKSYVTHKQTLEVLRGASLEVKVGETVAIIGASGAGKSTLLHVLGGLDTPDDGKVAVAGRNLYDLSERDRTVVRATAIGFVFQSYHLLPEMDVLENVLLPAMARDRFFSSRSKMRMRAMDLLKAVGLGDRADHTPMELSGGEQQRAALARALMNDPQVVLADEPTGNLDDATGSYVLSSLFSLTASRGHSLVLVTHNEKVAGSCNRVLRLKDGVLAKA